MTIGKEIEAAFIDIDKDEYRSRLKEAGATLVQPEVLMCRSVFDTGPSSFLRVRDEGRRVIVTYKKVDDLSLTGVNEVNVEVDNYKNAVTLLEAAGLKIKARQATLREEWRLGEAEITIDTWPALPPYTEIEGPSVEAVEAAATKLGFAMDEAFYGSVDQIYKHYYGVEVEDVNYCPEIILGKMPAFLKGKKIVDSAEESGR